MRSNVTSARMVKVLFMAKAKSSIKSRIALFKLPAVFNEDNYDDADCSGCAWQRGWPDSEAQFVTCFGGHWADLRGVSVPGLELGKVESRGGFVRVFLHVCTTQTSTVCFSLQVYLSLCASC